MTDKSQSRERFEAALKRLITAERLDVNSHKLISAEADMHPWELHTARGEMRKLIAALADQPTVEQSRKRFERYATKRGLGPFDKDMDNDGYADSLTQEAFIAWQAALADQPPLWQAGQTVTINPTRIETFSAEAKAALDQSAISDAAGDDYLTWARSILDDLEADNKSAALSKLMSFLRTSEIQSGSPVSPSQEVAELRAQVERLKEYEELDKIMQMSGAELRADLISEGKDPDQVSAETKAVVASALELAPLAGAAGEDVMGIGNMLARCIDDCRKYGWDEWAYEDRLVKLMQEHGSSIVKHLRTAAPSPAVGGGTSDSELSDFFEWWCRVNGEPCGPFEADETVAEYRSRKVLQDAGKHERGEQS